jgi:hypothetical protein
VILNRRSQKPATSIDVQHGAVDVLIRHQHDDRLGDLVRRTDPLARQGGGSTVDQGITVGSIGRVQKRCILV